MKIWLWLVVFGASSAFADIGLRTFTAQDGRTLKAGIVLYDPVTDKVKIQREDNKLLTVPSTSFSEKDQTYIKKWYAASVFSSAAKFKLDVERKEISSTKKEHEVDLGEEFGGGRRGESGVQTVAIDKVSQYEYKLSLENRSDATLSNILMEYRIYYEQEQAVEDEKANKNRPEDDPRPQRYQAVEQQKLKDGQARIKPIESRETKETATGRVTLLERSASRDWGDKIDLKSSLHGVWIKLVMKGPDGENIVRELAHPPSIPKKFSWDAPETQEKEVDPVE